MRTVSNYVLVQKLKEQCLIFVMRTADQNFERSTTVCGNTSSFYRFSKKVLHLVDQVGKRRTEIHQPIYFNTTSVLTFNDQNSSFIFTFLLILHKIILTSPAKPYFQIRIRRRHSRNLWGPVVGRETSLHFLVSGSISSRFCSPVFFLAFCGCRPPGCVTRIMLLSIAGLVATELDVHP